MKNQQSLSANILGTGKAQPVKASQRIVVLDALRGFALMGIALANYPEFTLWTFLSETEQAEMPSARIDNIVHWLQYLLVDGKFYTIFSILFGIGFSIIITHAMQRQSNGFSIFFRRMTILLLIGLAHIMLIWSGDILMLYAAIGLLLPLFRNCKNRQLLQWACFFFLLPIAISAWRTLSGINPAHWFYQKWWSVATSQGINEQNFATWLRDAKTYPDTFSFLLQGAVERTWEFVNGQRYFKVLGLFLIGYYIGRQQLFQQLKQNKQLLLKMFRTGIFIAFPLSIAYAWHCANNHPWGSTAHELLYAVSVYPLGATYMAALCLLYLKFPKATSWRILAYTGRMALTCYILQSLFGILLFYGIGFGWGTSMGLWQSELISLIVFSIETLLCSCWLRFFNFGPLEWLWRMLTYWKWFPLVKHTQASEKTASEQ